MNTMVRNRSPFYYALYEGMTAIEDENGNKTGEYERSYTDPVLMKANISPATGISNTEQFGNLEKYDKVIVTAEMQCPINENSILWIDDLDTEHPYDYIVKRVAKSLNTISIAIAKVTVENQ